MPLTTPTEQQSRIIWFALTGLAVAALLALMAGAVWGLGAIVELLSPVLWPLAIAAVVACLLSPVVDMLEGRRVPRAHAILLVFVFAFAVLLGVLAIVVPQVVMETAQLAAKVPEYSERLQDRINHLLAQPPDFLRHFLPPPAANASAASHPPNSALASATGWLTGNLPEMSTWLLKRVAGVASGFSLLTGLALVPVYAFYFLLEKSRIQSRWKHYLPLRDSSATRELVFVLEAISQLLVAFFRGQLLVAISDAVLYTAGFLLVGLNYALLLGFVAILLAMIPFLGAIMLCVTALTLALVQFGDWPHPVMVLGVFVVVQTLESVVISPKIMKDRVGLHPMVIIIAVMAGTKLLGGILGGVLAIPLAAALRVLLFRYVWKKT
jgi:predicted PurR-regulated permease PerM